MYGKTPWNKGKKFYDKRGLRSSSYIHSYVTPFGFFHSPSYIEEYLKDNDLGITKNQVVRYCNNANLYVTKRHIAYCDFLKMSDVNKTFKEVGFYCCDFKYDNKTTTENGNDLLHS